IETPQSGVTPHNYKKRRRQNSQVTANDENIPPTPSGTSQKRARISEGSSSTPKPHSVRQPFRPDDVKMKNVLDAIKGQGWTLGEFLYGLFRRKEEDQTARSNQHAQAVSKFLTGNGEYTPSDILTCWMTSPYRAGSAQSPEMYSTTTPYAEIRPVQ
ncbi:hypothetical protein B0H17DRAFT_864983, partial [Mycena rosella]